MKLFIPRGKDICVPCPADALSGACLPHRAMTIATVVIHTARATTCRPISAGLRARNMPGHFKAEVRLNSHVHYYYGNDYDMDKKHSH